MMPSDDKRDSQAIEIEDLKERLAAYKSLEEDLAANRIFDKAKKQISKYLALGGIIAILSSIIGIKTVTEYTKAAAKEKIDAIAADEIKKALQIEGERQITRFVAEKQADFIVVVQQQVERIIATSQPVGQAPRAEPLIAVSKSGSVDYTAKMSKVRNSGSEASTVGFAVAAALEFQIEKSLGRKVIISPRHIHYLARLKRGTEKSNSGAFIRDAVDILSKVGGIEEAAWPYKSGEFASAPPDNLDKVAHFKITNAKPVQNLTELKTALLNYGPVAGGLTLYLSSLRPTTIKTGIIPMPSAKESQLGAHAVIFIGFDDQRKLLKFQNQWGTEWGENGYGYISYDYADKFLLDAWSISLK